jgi:hypothetical protein
LLSAQQQFHQVATSLDQRNNFPRHPRGITPNPPNVLPMSWLSSVTHVLASCPPRPSPPTPLAERGNHRLSPKKSDAHFNEVQETAIAIKTRELRMAHECCSFSWGRRSG